MGAFTVKQETHRKLIAFVTQVRTGRDLFDHGSVLNLSESNERVGSSVTELLEEELTYSLYCNQLLYY